MGLLLGAFVRIIALASWISSLVICGVIFYISRLSIIEKTALLFIFPTYDDYVEIWMVSCIALAVSSAILMIGIKKANSTLFIPYLIVSLIIGTMLSGYFTTLLLLSKSYKDSLKLLLIGLGYFVLYAWHRVYKLFLEYFRA